MPKDRRLVGEVRDVLDIGCGTGIAARLFAARGCRVLGVESDPRMAALAHDYGIEGEVGKFEEGPGRGRTFDLATCRQAWHWVAPEAGAACLATLLRLGASFAVFWNYERRAPEARTALEKVYERIVPLLAGRVEGARPDRADEGRPAGGVLSQGRRVRSTGAARLPVVPALWLGPSGSRTSPPMATIACRLLTPAPNCLRPWPQRSMGSAERAR